MLFLNLSGLCGDRFYRKGREETQRNSVKIIPRAFLSELGGLCGLIKISISLLINSHNYRNGFYIRRFEPA